jgi:hypothetical protein
MRLVGAAALSALLLGGSARAADKPAAYGVAQQGSFKVVASVLLADRGGEMKGVWLDAKAGCRASRLLRVDISIDLVDAAGKTRRVNRWRRGLVANCAEGGPNFGFDLAPRALGFGCPSGRWKPGRYSMTTRVTELRSGLVAAASLYRQVTRRC